MLIQAVKIQRSVDHKLENHTDFVAAEEPLEIRLEADFEGKRIESQVAVTMRTPGNDEELTLGFLFTENILQHFSFLLSVSYCQTAFIESGKQNVIRVKLKPGIEFNPALLKRNFFASSSCGICGKASIESVENFCTRIEDTNFKVSGEILVAMPYTLQQAQSAFKLTGGIHAAGLFDMNGKLIAFREDIGRHNALDKLIAYGLMCNFDFSKSILLLSGRASFELMQKAAKAGMPVVAAIGAPSSLAIELATKMNITLIGFLKRGGFNLYSSFNRIL
jgi:FdhD protein